MWIKRFLCLFLLVLLLLGAAQADTRLIALNVGKADALLLLTDAQEAYLIDAGLERTYPVLRTALRYYGITRLNGVFLTHCDKDHYGGLSALAQSEIAVDAWYASAIYYDIPSGGHPIQEAAALRGDDVHWLSAGDVLALHGDAVLTVLGPVVTDTVNENNNSLVFHVETKDGTLLFTGDMKLAEEQTLLDRGAFPPSDVLKVPFHGDNSASGNGLVQQAQPRLAVISTSTVEEADTPAPSVLKRYARGGATCLVTQDFDRGIEVVMDQGRLDYHDLHFDLPPAPQGIRAAIDPKEDVLILRNSDSEDISLAGWLVYFSRGEISVVLPQDAVLSANGVYKIGTRETTIAVSLRLDRNRLWHQSSPDRAQIYDAYGRLVAQIDYGMTESPK